MDVGDDVLQEGIAELTLDRPPSCHLHDGHGLGHAPSRLDRTTSKDEEYFAHAPLSFDPSVSHTDVVNERTVLGLPCTCQIDADVVGIGKQGDYDDRAAPSPNNDASLVDNLRHEISSKFNSASSSSVLLSHSGRLGAVVPILRKETLGKPKKRVIFPDEEHCVKELIEPVDPWLNMPVVKRRDVISMYKNACQKLRTRPCETLVKQIQNSPDLSTRLSLLSLRGTKLDARACEALESVFQRVQFESLDIENCGLEEEGATSVLEMIEFYHSACRLNIACNPKIGIRGWQALCRMLKKTPCLTYLDARRTLLTDQTMPTFGRCLKADPHLRILHLEGVYLSGRPLLILTTAMKYNTILEELYLGDNDLNCNDGPSIGTMLTNNSTLSLLDLRNNMLRDVGVGHIGAGLADQAGRGVGGLASLILWNNGLTHEGMSYLYEGLVRTASLTALNLGQNRIGDLGMQRLKPALIKNRSLQKIGLLNTKLGSEGAVALAEVLADSLLLTRIDLRENSIQVAGLMAFSLALKVNRSLVRLDLDKDVRQEMGMEAVLQSVLVDIYDYCHRNKLLARQASSATAATSSSGMPLSRVSSTSSETRDLNYLENLFHPENRLPQVVPSSPVSESPAYAGPKLVPKLDFDETLNKSPDPDRSTGIGRSVKDTDDLREATVSNRPTSLVMEESSDSLSSKASRFSVTKIFGGSIGDIGKKTSNRLVKQSSKEKPDFGSSTKRPSLDCSTEMASFAESTSSASNSELSSEIRVNDSPDSECSLLLTTVSSSSGCAVDISGAESAVPETEIVSDASYFVDYVQPGDNDFDHDSNRDDHEVRASCLLQHVGLSTMNHLDCPSVASNISALKSGCVPDLPDAPRSLPDDAFMNGQFYVPVADSGTVTGRIVAMSVADSSKSLDENIGMSIAGSELLESPIFMQSGPRSWSADGVDVLGVSNTKCDVSVANADMPLPSAFSVGHSAVEATSASAAFNLTCPDLFAGGTLAVQNLNLFTESLADRRVPELDQKVSDDLSQLPIIAKICSGDGGSLNVVHSVREEHLHVDTVVGRSIANEKDFQARLNMLRSRSDKGQTSWNKTMLENGTAELCPTHTISVHDAAL